jgi:hypothetical protein
VGAQVEGVDFSKATGDARTQLPDGVRRPDHWQPYLAPDETGSDPAT